MNSKIVILTSLWLTGMFCSLYAQTLSRSVISSTSSSKEQLSFTTGETVIATGNSGTTILTQGFHQPDRITGTFVDPLLGTTTFMLYPVPATETLNLEIQTDKRRVFLVDFTDVRGRSVGATRRIETDTNATTEFQVSSFASGAYFLLLRNEDGQLLKSLRFRKTD
ncbi:MAG: T9SS type A sorting domain-containing protein [Bacteroidia bacterium]